VTVLAIAASFAIPLLAGLALVSGGVRGSRLAPAVVNTTAGLGVGLGMTSCALSVLRWAVGRPAAGFIATETIVLIALALFVGRAGDRRGVRPSAERAAGHLDHLLWTTFLCFLVAAAVIVAFRVLARPHGEWDAWAIWNLHARFMARGEDDWLSAFSPALLWSHPDYPLLVPALVARGWAFVGGETQAVPAVLGMVFSFGTVALLAAAVTVLGDGRLGALMGIVLLGTPAFLWQGAAQMADAPLAFFFLLTAVLLSLADTPGSDARRALFVAGMSAGFAAWTKNEGLLFVVAVLVARMVATEGLPIAARLARALPLAAGLAAVLVVSLAFKIGLAPVNDLVGGQAVGATTSRALDVECFLVIGRHLARKLLEFGGAWINPLLLLGLYLAVFGVGAGREHRARLVQLVTILMVMTAGYACVYVVTPAELEWHLGTSLHRLLLQLWPLALLAFGCAAGSPRWGASRPRGANESTAPS